MSAMPAGIETKNATSWNQPRSRGFEDKPTFTEPTIYRRERVADRTRDRGPTVRTQPARDATRAVFNRSNCASRVPIPRSILAIAQRVLRARLYAVTSQ